MIAPTGVGKQRPLEASKELLAVTFRSELIGPGDLASVQSVQSLICREPYSKLCVIDEFGLVLSEVRMGESRQTALRSMSDRVGAPELSAFVRALVQADQLGISLGRILRVQAADSRLRRQAAAEEKAMKAPIKMLFPTVLFIFPSMFVVVLGPALLNIMSVLK